MRVSLPCYWALVTREQVSRVCDLIPKRFMAKLPPDSHLGKHGLALIHIIIDGYLALALV
jgi:hypothetical protein